MKKRKKVFYEILWGKYPDIVGIKEVMEMLGGLGEVTTAKLIRENHIKHFYIRRAYLVPKVWLIDFVRSDYYESIKNKLKAQV